MILRAGSAQLDPPLQELQALSEAFPLHVVETDDEILRFKGIRGVLIARTQMVCLQG
jgi:hypothetical protein